MRGPAPQATSRVLLPAILACAGASGLLAARARAQVVAITDAKIYPVASPVIARGTVLIRDGRIAAVGDRVEVPAGARVIDAAGKVVTPGFMNAATSLGVVEVEAIRPTNDDAVNNPRITAAFNATDAVDPFSSVIPVERVEGLTRAVVTPGGGKLINGQGIVIDLGTEGMPGMIDRTPVAMYVDLSSAGARAAGGSRAAALLALREALADARDFAANRRAFEANARRAYALSRLDLEALVPVVEGREPLAVHVERAADILEALRFAREQKVRLILVGAADGWVVAGQIAGEGVPVVLDPLSNLPDFEARGATLENAARLARAGVTVALTTSGFSAHNARNVKYEAGNAVAYGMPYDAALRAVTVNPARIFGIADRYGTLEPGKDADVVVWSGDPFELTTLVEHVFIKGVEMPADTRQRELLRRYRVLDDTPPAYKR
jgi:imidazolonepropionase-like amidohydrolase